MIDSWAWAAGLFEGEGSICIYQQRDCPMSIHLSLAMTDEDVVKRFAVVAGYGKVHPESIRGKYKPSFRWQIGDKTEVKRILESMIPYLGERRKAKALEALPLCVYSPGYEKRKRR